MIARFCLRCGRRLGLVREQGRRRPRCPACGWTYYENPVPAAVALIERRGRLLLTRRARPPYAGTWDLPGGFLEGVETPERALRRELKEELGVRVGRLRFVEFATDRYGPKGMPVLTLVYRVSAAGAMRAGDDVAEARWFPKDRLPLNRIGFPSMRRLLRGWSRRGRRGPRRPA